MTSNLGYVFPQPVCPSASWWKGRGGTIFTPFLETPFPPITLPALEIQPHLLFHRKYTDQETSWLPAPATKNAMCIHTHSVHLIPPDQSKPTRQSSGASLSLSSIHGGCILLNPSPLLSWTSQFLYFPTKHKNAKIKNIIKFKFSRDPTYHLPSPPFTFLGPSRPERLQMPIVETLQSGLCLSTSSWGPGRGLCTVRQLASLSSKDY